ncbi:hypothetical protein GCM10023189_38080 [Nibrella saemangeumensis]|uniref:Uncharacterized protein n=1 Tax=Nibrella saemangeumensis TaxID=1084526 RepID=A0ABP8N927_9BACT
MENTSNPDQFSDALQQQVTAILVQHYETNLPELATDIKRLVVLGRTPEEIEALVQQWCPVGSRVPAHLYLLASYYKQILNQPN